MDLETVWKQYDSFLSSVRDNQEDEGCEKDDSNYCRGCDNVLAEDMTSGIRVCTRCGLVNEADIIDSSPEWSMVNNDDSTKKDMSRCGVPTNMLLEKSSMSTVIRTNKYHFMRKIHNQLSMNYVERGRYHVFESINKMAGEQGHLSSVVVEQAKYYYKVLSERKLSRGVIRKGLVACCIVYACKTLNVPRSLKEISKMTDVSVPVLNKTMKLFFEIMKDVLAKCDDNTQDFMFEATECAHLIKRYIHTLKVADKSVKQRLIQRVTTLNDAIKADCVLECKTPSAITTGLIVYAAREMNLKEVTKNIVSITFNVSVVTINKVVKIIDEYIQHKRL